MIYHLIALAVIIFLFLLFRRMGKQPISRQESSRAFRAIMQRINDAPTPTELATAYDMIDEFNQDHCASRDEFCLDLWKRLLIQYSRKYNALRRYHVRDFHKQ